VAKQLFARHVRYGDWVRFPGCRADGQGVDAVVAWDDAGRLSGVFVNTASQPRELVVSDWDEKLLSCNQVLRTDAATGSRVVREPFVGSIRLGGYGVAIVTNSPTAAELD
jgi:hypothetical protein